MGWSTQSTFLKLSHQRVFCSSSHEKVQPTFYVYPVTLSVFKELILCFFFWRLTGRKWPQYSHELTPSGAINANIYAIELIYAVWKNPLRAICYDIWILTGNINHSVLGNIYWVSAIKLNEYKMIGLYKLVCRFWIWKKKHSSLKVWLSEIQQYEMQRKGR